MHFIEHRYAGDPTNWWAPNRPAWSHAAHAGFEIVEHPEPRSISAAASSDAPPAAPSIPPRQGGSADDRSRDDLERAQQQVALGPGDRSGLVAVRRDGDLRGRGHQGREPAELPRVLGGISPIDPGFIQRLEGRGVLDHLDVVAVHGFPLDWNLWQIHEWPAKIDEIRAVTDKPIWVTRSASRPSAPRRCRSGAEAHRRAADRQGAAHPLVQPLRPAPAWEATTRHREAEGSSYYRHFYMGLLREDGTPKPGLEEFEGTRRDGLCQWFHYEDHRLDDAVAWMKRLGVKHLRTGLSWADSFRPNALDWFDRQMEALADFDVTVTFCFTPEHAGSRRTTPARRSATM
jgi:hypothetical protein